MTYMVETLYIDCSEMMPSAAMIEYICTGHDNSVPPLQPRLRPHLNPNGTRSDDELMLKQYCADLGYMQSLTLELFLREVNLLIHPTLIPLLAVPTWSATPCDRLAIPTVDPFNYVHGK